MAALYLAGPLHGGPVFNVIGASSAVAVIVGARRYRPRGRIAWYAIALGQLLFVAGDVLAILTSTACSAASCPSRSLADPLYLADVPASLVAGLLALLRLSLARGATGPPSSTGSSSSPSGWRRSPGPTSWPPTPTTGPCRPPSSSRRSRIPSRTCSSSPSRPRCSCAATAGPSAACWARASWRSSRPMPSATAGCSLHGGYETGGLLDRRPGSCSTRSPAPRPPASVDARDLRAGAARARGGAGGRASRAGASRSSRRRPSSRPGSAAHADAARPAARARHHRLLLGTVFLLILLRLAGVTRAQLDTPPSSTSADATSSGSRRSCATRRTSCASCTPTARSPIPQPPPGQRLLGVPGGEPGLALDDVVHPGDPLDAVRAFLADPAR